MPSVDCARQMPRAGLQAFLRSRGRRGGLRCVVTDRLFGGTARYTCLLARRIGKRIVQFLDVIIGLGNNAMQPLARTLAPPDWTRGEDAVPSPRIIVKGTVQPFAFLAWCEISFYESGNPAGSQFANFKMQINQQHDRGGQRNPAPHRHTVRLMPPVLKWPVPACTRTQRGSCYQHYYE